MIKKLLTFAIIFLFVCTNFVSGFNIQLKNSTIPLITSSGNTLYVGGTGPGNYTKIQDAIDNASVGDTVFVFNDSSPYYENIVIDKPINLIGENKNTTVIDGNYQGNVVVIQSDYVTVKGFKIINCVMENQTKYVIHILDSENVVIKDNIISVGKNFPIYGIFGIGIFIENSSYNIIQNNIIFKEGRKCVTRGISVFYASNYNNCSGNEIYGYSCGIKAESSNNNVFYANNIHYNEWGIVIYNYNNYIIKNQINYNEWCGITLVGCRNTLVYRNTISYNNDDGILIDGGTSLNIINNNILHNNPRGIYLYDPSPSKIAINISKNNFINNGINAFFINHFLPVKTRWYNNYWGMPHIFPKIIVGGLNIFLIYYLPVYIPWFNIDWHPAKKPYDIL